MRTWKKTAAAAAALAIVLSFAGAAHAVALYWSTTGLSTHDRSRCFDYAYGAAHAAGMSQIVRTSTEVRGEYGPRVYASITCVERGNLSVIAVVMVAAEEGGEAEFVRAQLRTYMQNAD